MSDATTSALDFAAKALTALPALMQAGMTIAQAIAKATQYRDQVVDMKENGREPTAEEWAALNESIEGKRDELHSQSAPGTGGEPA